MRPVCYLTALFVCAPVVAHAALPLQEACRRLHAGLSEEVRLLSEVRDADSAQKTVEPLSRVVRELAALRDEVDEDELWRFINDDPNTMQQLLRLIEALALHLQMLEMSNCFGNTQLMELLQPFLSPAS